MAGQYWQNQGQPARQLFIALDYAYHGDTVGAMSPSADGLFTAPFDALRFKVLRAAAPYCYRCPVGLTRETCQLECTQSLTQLLAQHGSQVAAVIIEPMLQGAGGMIVWPTEFLTAVRNLCDQYQVLMIADEVFSGFGRTGKMFACEHANVTPDLLCLSKGLTAGYLPLAITFATESIYNAFLSEDRRRTFFHGHSYTANPLGCAVGIESLAIFREEQVLTRIAAINAQLEKGLKDLIDLPVVGQVRVIGAVGILELVNDKVSRSTGGYLDNIGMVLYQRFLQRGLLLRPLGNVLYFMPPYVITDHEIEWVIGQITSVLKELSHSMSNG
jgi:adenosylmethionine-8-amino-7-oxononanoate aminotransferase